MEDGAEGKQDPSREPLVQSQMSKIKLNDPRSTSNGQRSANRVIVVGGGWAGLAAAVELVRHGIPVVLLESARQLGGRARCAPFGAQRVDNGQHIMVGAYRDTLALLKILGVKESRAFLRRPLHLHVKSDTRKEMRLTAPPLPAPFHLALGLGTATGLPLADKLKTLRFWNELQRTGFALEQDMSVAALLSQHMQPQSVTRNLWVPLCLATLNTPPQEASAQVFLRVLQEAFGTRRRHSDLLIPRTDLGAILPGPAFDFIEHNGGSVMLGQRVTGIRLHKGQATGVELAGGGEMKADHVVLAVSHTACQKLLAPHPPLTQISQRIAELATEPICNVYLQYPPKTRLPSEMVGLLGGAAQWVFDRALCGQPGIISAVISAGGPHMDLENAALIQQVTAELARFFPHWPRPERGLVIREKRATFACRVGSDTLRPTHNTPVQGCWLAGDYTATGLPATLEGAVRSGLQCARHILAKYSVAGHDGPLQ